MSRAAHTQPPAWKGLQLGNSEAVLLEAASRIASQHSQDTHNHRLLAPSDEHEPHRSAYRSLETKSTSSFPATAEAVEKLQQRKAVFAKAELGHSGSLVLKSVRRCGVFVVVHVFKLRMPHPCVPASSGTRQI
jgi:hypothetical protein